jgi:hypothetical protein
MTELHPLKHKSSSVLEIGFEVTDGSRGNLHVQFHDDGKRTSRGYYKDAPRALYNSLCTSRTAGSFLNQNLKPHFEWVRHQESEPAEITYFREHPDLTLPDIIIVPASVPIADTVACVDAQRKHSEGSLFT